MLNLKCTICEELVSGTDIVTVAICGHMFHSHCVNKWLERNNTCPICRCDNIIRTMHRVYFSLEDDPDVDENALEARIDAALRKLEETHLKFAMKITALEQKLRESNSEIQEVRRHNEYRQANYFAHRRSLLQEVSLFRQLYVDAKNGSTQMRSEIISLKEKIKRLEAAQTTVKKQDKKTGLPPTALRFQLSGNVPRNTNQGRVMLPGSSAGSSQKVTRSGKPY